MLHRTLRLKDALSFQKAFRFGKPFEFGSVGCKVLFTTEKGLKIGIITPKKRFRLAVDRNRAKRLLSEAVAPVVGVFPENAFIVVFFRNNQKIADFASVQADMEGLVRVISTSVGRKG